MEYLRYEAFFQNGCLFSVINYFCEKPHPICLTEFWIQLYMWGKVFKNGPSKICGRQPLKNFTLSILEYFVSCIFKVIGSYRIMTKMVGNHLQILLLILANLSKLINLCIPWNHLSFPLKSSGCLWFSDKFRGNRINKWL